MGRRMKLIHKTLAFEVPSWVEWETTDKFGQIRLWEFAPKKRHLSIGGTGWMADGRSAWLCTDGTGRDRCRLKPPADWRKTKRRIK